MRAPMERSRACQRIRRALLAIHTAGFSGGLPGFSENPAVSVDFLLPKIGAVALSTALFFSDIMGKNKEYKQGVQAMPDPTAPKREHPSTYFVQDRSNLDEMARLQIQDQMITAGMGGVLAEQPDPASLRSMLDVGCGTGGWLIEVATTYPGIKRLVGVDISTKMLDYARTQAAEQGVSDRVEFAAMDALRMLEFPRNTFDLVNHRYGMSWLRKRD